MGVIDKAPRFVTFRDSSRGRSEKGYVRLSHVKAVK